MRKHVNGLVIMMTGLLLSCGGGLKGLPGAGALKTDIPDKYADYIEECEQYEKDVNEAKKYIEETPGALAEALDLKEDATLEEVTEAITSRIQDEVIKAGAHVEITIEGGLDASAAAAAGTGGASAEAGVSAEVKVTIKVVGEIEVSEGLQELIDAGKLALERIIGSAKKLKALAEKAPELIERGTELAARSRSASRPRRPPRPASRTPPSVPSTSIDSTLCLATVPPLTPRYPTTSSVGDVRVLDLEPQGRSELPPGGVGVRWWG
ncbi:MAG: hypothetical protein JRG91_01580 [Deltaproteobacteria bacterium]|nr:hypothetical protein [Deltaproteobacteria bacterium]